jgi:predicted PurR-regulated permease PerM
MTGTRFHHAFLVFLVVAITAAFVMMVRDFLLVIILAALFAGVVHPAHLRIVRLFGGRQAPGALVTLALLLVIVFVPVLTIAGAVANEVASLNQTTLPRLQRLIDEPGEFERRLRPLPGYSFIRPYRGYIITKSTAVLEGTGAFVMDALSSTTRATAVFLFYAVVLLYTMFYLLIDGPAMLSKILSHLPLAETDKAHVMERFVSVTRATLKGTMLVGAAQGSLGGLAFWAVGVDAPLFWGTIMTVLSVVPGIGAALVWVPAVVILLALGQVWQAIVLGLFCAVVVGTVDNILRPVLVGHDTQMHELLIFFSTLGGLLAFGGMGFILGPVLAALFVAVWEMFGASFRTELADPTIIRAD